MRADEQRLFYLRGGELRAVEAETGRLVWAFRVGRRAQLETGAGHLIVVGRRAVHALDVRTGAVRWQRAYRVPEGVETFSVHEDLLVVTVGGRLIGYDLTTGRERRRVRGPYGLTREAHRSVLTVSGGGVFLELSYHSLTSRPDVFAFDTATGERL